MGQKNEKALQLLFSYFNEEEISQFYHLYNKLYAGVERLEKGTD